MSLTDPWTTAIVGQVKTYTILGETGNMINSYASRIEAYSAFLGLIPQHDNLALIGYYADGGVADSLVYERAPTALSAAPSRPRARTLGEAMSRDSQRRREAESRERTRKEDELAWEYEQSREYERCPVCLERICFCSFWDAYEHRY